MPVSGDVCIMCARIYDDSLFGRVLGRWSLSVNDLYIDATGLSIRRVLMSSCNTLLLLGAIAASYARSF